MLWAPPRTLTLFQRLPRRRTQWRGAFAVAMALYLATATRAALLEYSHSSAAFLPAPTGAAHRPGLRNQPRLRSKFVAASGSDEDRSGVAFFWGKRSTPEQSKSSMHVESDPPPKNEVENDGNWLEQTGIRLQVLFFVSIAAAIVVAGVGFANPGLFTSTNGPAIKSKQEQVFEQWYARAVEASKKTKRMAALAQQTFDSGVATKPTTGPKVVRDSVVARIRDVEKVLDMCQQDIYDEFWVGLQTYQPLLRSLVPLFNYYTDAAFPLGQKGSEVEQLRFALKFEVGRFTRGIAGFESGVEVKNIRDIERAFADMSLAYDRYLKAGNLYEGYDPVTSTTVFYDNIDEKQLVYTPITLEQPRIRDDVLVIRGPDKGKTGKVIWLGRNGTAPGTKNPGEVASATVKLDLNPTLGKNVREVKTYPYQWIAVTRTSEQNFLLDCVLGCVAAIFSCGVTYPLDSLKARIQAGLPLLPPGGVPALFNGLSFNLWREVPQAGLYMGMFNILTRQFCLLPFIDANNPNLKFLIMIPAGSIGVLSASFLRAPFEVLNRQMQAGLADTEQEAFDNVFFKPPREEVERNLRKAWVLVIVKGVPFGALQCTLYEILKDKLELVQYGVPIAAMPFIWGALSGCFTGLLTNPPDVVLARISGDVAPKVSENSSAAHLTDGVVLREAGKDDDVWAQLSATTRRIYDEEGIPGFFRGASARALYFAPEACLWFAAYEWLRLVAQTVAEL